MQPRKKLALPIVIGISLILVGFVIFSGLLLGLFLFNSATDESGRGLRIRTLAELQFETSASPTVHLAPVREQESVPVAPVEASEEMVQPQLNADPGSAGQPAEPVSASSPAASRAAASAATTGSVTRLPSPTPTATPVATTGSVARSPLPTPTATPVPNTVSPTPTPSATATPVASPTSTARPSATSVPPSTDSPLITGRLLFDGVPAGQGVKLSLENQAYALVAETTVGSDGVYRFEKVPPSAQGYNVLFSQEANPQYQVDQVISWGWLGPVAVAGNDAIKLPDLDIALLGLEPTQPAPNAAFSAAAVTAGDPIDFRWSAYPQAAKYWVDLAQGEQMDLVWKSPSLQTTSVTFNGQTQSGAIQPGEYWWGVGARRKVGDYTLTVYGYVPVLLIDP
jgi:hypothetical protein